MTAPRLRSHLLMLPIVVMSACATSGKLLTVTVEKEGGRTELTYMKTAEPANLTREVRFSDDGDTISLTSLMKGVLHGEMITYHENGQRKELATYTDGSLTGPFKAYDNEGTVVFEGNLTDGKKSGTWVTWYDDTQKRQECQYENDALSGRCTYWFIDGHLQREETYSDGKLISSQNH